VQRWWRFTSPLILPQYYLPLVAYFGLFLIQRWYGSAEQGYYALALQWSAFAMVFTTSGVWIFWREVAHHAGQDRRHTAEVYRRFSTLFFYLALVLACGLSASSRLLVQVVAGERFRGAVPVLAIMAFYPISQTINQLTAASMKATERTASYARWSVLLSIPEILLTYLLLAPTSAAVPGLHLGAIGMGTKTALYGLATALVYDWLNCRYFAIGFGRVLLRKVGVAAVVGVLAIVLIGSGGPWLQERGLGALVALVVSAGGYGVAVALLTLARPQVAGLSRAELLRGLRWPGQS
jgi:O-antigen/teichoic acid export membrane protein